MKSLLLLVHILAVMQLGGCSLCPAVESLDITEGGVHSNGSIHLYGIEFITGTWYEVEENNQTTRYGCPCIGRICMFKCCPAGQEYLVNVCVDSNSSNTFSPQLFKEKEPSALKAEDTFFYLYGRTCDDGYLAINSGVDELYIQEDGGLLEIGLNGVFPLHLPKSYCAEMQSTNLIPARLVAFICFADQDSGDSYFLFAAYAAGLMLSIPFLLATLLVYALIPELRNLHGMCLMAYCAGLLVAFPFLAYLKLHIGQVGVQMAACFTVAFIVYYAFQTSFFWLNVMCFDIWRTFSGYRGGGTSKRREKKRFALYAVYAWGVPAVLTAVTIGMQFGDVPRYIITPGFGTKRCWFVNWLSEMVYFFTPVLVLVVCNVTFFSVTAHRIRSIKQETAILKGAESSRSDKLKKDKQRYALYLKLFMVMGVNWTVELISFAVGGSNWYWIVVDISNMTLGVFIFFIFVWKKKVRLLVQKRFRMMFGMESTAADSRTGRWTTNSAVNTEDTRVSTEDTTMRLKELH